jgi:hypothetical protein
LIDTPEELDQNKEIDEIDEGYRDIYTFGKEGNIFELYAKISLDIY